MGWEANMTTIQVHVPDEVRRDFEETFAGEDADVIIAGLMREAVRRRKKQEHRSSAAAGLRKLREKMPPLTDEELAKARWAGRP